ncbi:efflux RND transporter permease subunit [Pelagicoccus mobilis]|uniref:Efflux RND transporter permease subunit n=1 Tax=Pelagicoccus mobilis TaxID=415221 RepID=A0A934S6P3_9BACT|nr:efflux RND transporter permease subunit [Pelagicoccus mobilis]MBK1879933.1 efflux RND transporter permease subunit [Pelagicoccus mobilis]
MKTAIAWFTRNPVAANLLMICLLLLGGYALRERILFQEFPDYPGRTISVSVGYRGSTPEEIEESIVTRIEEAVYDIPGVKRLNARASESSGQVSILVEDGFDIDRVYDEVKSAVDGITTFPREARPPRVRRPQWQERVISVVIAGDLSEWDMKKLSEQVRDEIMNLPGVSLADLLATRPYEIGIEVSPQKLRQYGLSISQVSSAIRGSSINLSAGNIKAVGGDIRLRAQNQAYSQEDFENIVLRADDQGSRLTLGDVATVTDGFDEIPVESRHNGERAVAVNVYRTGNQSAIEVGHQVREYIKEAQPRMPEGISLTHWNDDSERIEQRLDTLSDSAIMGFLLVVGVLSLFLRPMLAFWVALGIPVAFAGAFAVLPFLGVSINLITLFAFILVLGIVVDDAIVTGENVFSHMQKGKSPLDAAIDGTQEVSVPVTFGILTTIAAFYPLMVMSGWRGNMFAQIPLVVIPVLVFSLVESKLILPAHLRHCKNIGHGKSTRNSLNFLQKIQRRIADTLETFVRRVYSPVLDTLLHHRYSTLAAFIGLLGIYVGLIVSDTLPYRYWPRVPRDTLRVNLTMPTGTAFETTQAHMERIEKEALKLADELNDASPYPIISDVFATAGGSPFGSGWGGSRAGIAERGELVVAMSLKASSEAEMDTGDLAHLLRIRIGKIPDAQRFTLSYSGSGEAISVDIRSRSTESLGDISLELQNRLRDFDGLFDISDSYETANDEFEIKLKPQAEQLGLSASKIASQIREAFFGVEAQRIPRGRDDVRVMVRYPLEHRKSLSTLENMLIRVSGSVEVPFSSVAELIPGKSLPSIRRIDGKRQITVTADANPIEVDIEAILADLNYNIMPQLVEKYPDLEYELSGDARDRDEGESEFVAGIWFVLIAVYVLLAIPLRSYVQPLVVMSAIPFGIVGALMGHQIMSYYDSGLGILSMMSFLGMLALSGVVVNDSLVMVDFVNKKLKEGANIHEAVRAAGARRFRPILLTSLTTFFGLAPLMFEQSKQAKFMVPMAVSLGWGVIFATFITLSLVPVICLVFDDIKQLYRKIYGSPATEEAAIAIPSGESPKQEESEKSPAINSNAK